LLSEQHKYQDTEVVNGSGFADLFISGTFSLMTVAIEGMVSYLIILAICHKNDVGSRLGCAQ
jgi:hypothetical protein